jgi:hypothetical protein
MSNITIDNYEAYLLDLLEGNLPGEKQVELELFLIQHPELKTDLTELPLFTIEAKAPVFKAKNSLKRSEDELVSQDQFIAYIENQLPLNERVQLEKSCAANPSLANELNLYKKTIATVDPSVVYEPKHELKRKPKVIWFNLSATQFAAAASVLFLIGLFVLWPKSGEEHLNHNNTLAQNTTEKHTTPSTKNSAQTSSVVKETVLPTTVTNHAHSGNSNFSKVPKVAVNSVLSHTTGTQSNNNEAPPVQNSINEQNGLVKETPATVNNKEEKNTTLLAYNTKSTVDVITESDDEDAPEAPKKKGIWSLAKRALKNLNAVGVKSVDGVEEQTHDNTTYALTLGNIKITHKGN